MLLLPQVIFNGLIIGGTYAIMAVGLTLLMGYMNLVNFSHGEMYMLGSYFSYLFIVTLGLPHIIGIPLAIVLTFMLALIIERIFLRKLWGKDIMTRMIMTVGLMITIPNLVTSLVTAIPRKVPSPIQVEPIIIGNLRIAPIQFVIIASSVLVIVLFHLFMKYTKIGKGIRASFQDKEVASSMGINIKRIYAFTFGIGCAMAAASGALLSLIYNITPSMGGLVSSKSFAVVILGGLDSFAGGILAAITVGIAESFASTYIATGYKDAVAFVFLILILLIKPSGIMGKKGNIE